MSGKKDEGQGEKDLVALFEQGQTEIDTARSENLFKQLDSRDLTEQEQDIIYKRIELQRKMLEAYERKENERKVNEIRSVCPDFTAEEALEAIELCNGLEEEAALLLTSDGAFKKRLKDKATQKQKRNAQKERAQAPKPGGISRAPREPIKISTCGDGVFVGRFQQRLGPIQMARYKKPPKQQPAVDSAAKKSIDIDLTDNEENVEKDDKAVSDPKTETEVEGSASWGVKKARSKRGARKQDSDDATDEDEDFQALEWGGRKTRSQRQPSPDSKEKPDELDQKSDDSAVKNALDNMEEDTETDNNNEDVKEIKEFSPEKKAAEGVSEGSDVTVSDKSGGESDSGMSWNSKRRRTNLNRGRRKNWKGEHLTGEDMEVDSEMQSKQRSGGKLSVPKSGGRQAKLSDILKLGAKSNSPQNKKEEEGEMDKDVLGGKAIVEGDSGNDDKNGSMNDVGDFLGSKSNKPVAPSPKENLPPNADAEVPQKRVPASSRGTRAISLRGHTCRGRVRQKAQKKVELIEVGKLRVKEGWFNAGYIFPESFKARTLFRSSVALDALCVHECQIVGKGGKFWPNPTFVVLAKDREEEPLVAKSCTGCWSAVLKRINGEIERRRKEGENLPPAPKTAIAGPEYFGLIQADIVEKIEELDPDHACALYWEGKEDREVAAAGLNVRQRGQSSRQPRAPKMASTLRGTSTRKRRNKAWSEDDGSDDNLGSDAEDAEAAYAANKWSAISRKDRYKRRCANRGTEDCPEDEDNPLPDLIDPITLEPVVGPAISPYGHVMGMATWKAVLSENRRCPFTKQDLSWEQCVGLTKSNIEKYKDRIIQL